MLGFLVPLLRSPKPGSACKRARPNHGRVACAQPGTDRLRDRDPALHLEVSMEAPVGSKMITPRVPNAECVS